MAQRVPTHQERVRRRVQLLLTTSVRERSFFFLSNETEKTRDAWLDEKQTKQGRRIKIKVSEAAFKAAKQILRTGPGKGMEHRAVHR